MTSIPPPISRHAALLLAQRVDAALDCCYGYGLSTDDPASFGAQTCLASALAGWHELLRQQLRGQQEQRQSLGRDEGLAFDVERVAAQVHRGWGDAAAHSWDKRGYGPVPAGVTVVTVVTATGGGTRRRFPDAFFAGAERGRGLAKYHARMRLADCPYAALGEDEKEKDRVVANVLLAAYLEAIVEPTRKETRTVTLSHFRPRCRSADLRLSPLQRGRSPD